MKLPHLHEIFYFLSSWVLVLESAKRLKSCGPFCPNSLIGSIFYHSVSRCLGLVVDDEKIGPFIYPNFSVVRASYFTSWMKTHLDNRMVRQNGRTNECQGEHPLFLIHKRWRWRGRGRCWCISAAPRGNDMTYRWHKCRYQTSCQHTTHIPQNLPTPMVSMWHEFRPVTSTDLNMDPIKMPERKSIDPNVALFTYLTILEGWIHTNDTIVVCYFTRTREY